MSPRKWCTRRRKTILALLLILYMLHLLIPQEDPLLVNSADDYIDEIMLELLKEENGSRCGPYHLDPFAYDVAQFDDAKPKEPKEACPGLDWVRCYLHECKVIDEVLIAKKNIICDYRDIIYINDNQYTLGPSSELWNNETYILQASDHVSVQCSSNSKFMSKLASSWRGYATGYRKSLSLKTPAADRNNTVNVLILCYDSTSRNGFRRQMPRSFEFLTDILGATVLNAYNLLGGETTDVLFPILTGKTQDELPEVRKDKNIRTMDSVPFIFYKMKENGYRTAFFEDMPWIGTFNRGFNGFKNQPTHHYLRSFFMEVSSKALKTKTNKLCVGGTPIFELMLHKTEQFFKLPGKHFAFTFIRDISHNDFNWIQTADEATLRFLKALLNSKQMEKTLLIVMGDHGQSISKSRNTAQGQIEERLPLMAVRIPQILSDPRLGIRTNLENNADVLTTPHDIHATLLDATDMKKYQNNYTIKGATMKRGISLFEEVTLSPDEAMFEATATYFVKKKKFLFRNRDISRIKVYGHETNCLNKASKYVHLARYCYCRPKIKGKFPFSDLHNFNSSY